jgi:hypothetical protein
LAFDEASVMASFTLAWTEIKVYVAEIGPGRGRPPRPSSCPFCDARRIWYDGWRIVFCVVLVDGAVLRFTDGLPLQRVVCASCLASWTLRPAFLYPHRSFAPDVVEAATATYLGNSVATYAAVASMFLCSPRSVWRWIGSLAVIAEPAALLAEAERQRSTGESAALIPREVPQSHIKAYSRNRAGVLLLALQTLCALGVWARSLVVPAADPSALRVHLNDRLGALAEVHLLTRPRFSPPLPVDPAPPDPLERPP